MKKSPFRSCSSAAVATFVAAIAMFNHAQAGNTWDGGGSTSDWSDPVNWDSDTLPAYGTLNFSGSTQTTNTVNANTSMNRLLWSGTSAWTLNASNGAVLSLFDAGGTQAKLENQSTGLVTANAPITFAANNASPANPFGEINAINGDITFGSAGALTVNGSSVNGLKFWGGAGRTVTFNNTVSAAGKWLATTGSGAITIGSTGSVTADNIFVMNGGVLNLGGALTGAVRLGGDFGATGNQDLTKSGTFNLTPTTGGLTFSGTVNSVTSNTSGALMVNSQNTSGTNTLSGLIVLDSNLTINQAAGGTLTLSQQHTDGATGATGTNIKSLALTLAPAAGATINANGGIYSLTNNGSITNNGPGTLNIGAPSNAGNLFVRQGTVQIGTGASYTGSAYSSVGQLSGDNGTLTLTGNASITDPADFNLADTSGSRGTLNMQSTGTVSVTTLYVGKTGTAVGVLNQSAGTLTYPGAVGGTEWRIGGGSSGQTGAYGVYNMSGGILNTGANFQVGGYGVGVMNLTGGTVTTASWTDVARFSTSVGLLNMSGGTWSQTGTTTRFFVAEDGTGVMNLTGGTLTSSGGIVLGQTATGNGILNVLTGGTASTVFINKAAAATGRLYLNGGAVKSLATSAAATFLTGLTSTTVGPNGAVFDTTALSVTVAQPLLAPTGSGITNLPITNGGSGYVGQPVVQITGGGGTGATAVANVTGGVVTGITITNPGNDYTSAPTFTLLGGGSAVAATPGTAVIGANITTGGLTKNGTNILTLSGANTFNGNIAINGGVLILNYATNVAYPGNITGVGQLSKLGAGTLTISGTISATSASNTPIMIGNGAAGGVMTLTSTSVVNSGASEIYVGNGAGGSGTLNLNGGTINLGNWLAVARGGASGTMNMTAGTINKTGVGNITIGGSGAGGGVLNQSGGTINGLGSNFFVGEVAGTGVYNLSGTGVANVPVLSFGQNAASTGTVNLDGGTLAANQIVKVNAGATATFNFNGGTLKANSGANAAFLTGLTNTFVKAGGAIIDTNGNAITIGQNLLTDTVSLGGGLTKNGTGTLTLAGANSYTGLTTVNAGTLALSGAGSPSNRVFNTTVNTGATLQLLDNNQIGTSTVTLNGGTFDLNTKIEYFDTLAMSSNASVIGTGASAFTLEHAGTAVISATGGGNAGTISAGFGITSQFGVAPNAARTAQFNIAASTNLTVSGIIRDTLEGTSNVGSVDKTGAGTLLLSGANTFTGVTSVSNGTLALAGAGSINNSSSITVNGSGAKYLHNSSVASTRAITLTQGTLDGTGTVGNVTVGSGTGGIVTNGDGGSSALTIGNLTFGGAATITARVSAAANPGIVVSGLLTSAAGITMNASNTAWTNGQEYRLLGYSTFTGSLSDFTKGTIANLGARQSATLTNPTGYIALSIAGDAPVWRGTGDATWTSVVQTPKNWVLQSNSATPTDFFVANDTPIFDDTATGSTAVGITENVNPASVVFNNSSLNYTLNSSGGFGITGGTLLKQGTAALTINTANTFSGGTTLNAGALNLNNASAIGMGTFIIAGGTLDNTSGGAITLSTNNAITLNSDLTFGGTNALNLGTGALGLSANRTFTTNGTAPLTIGGVISGLGSTLTKAGNGTLNLAGANTFSGGAIVNAGTLILSGNNTISGGLTVNAGTLVINAVQSFTGGVLINGGTVQTGNTGAFNTVAPNVVTFGPASTGTLQLNGNNVTIGGLISDANLGSPIVENGAAGTATLTVSNSGPNTYVGLLRDGAAGVLALTKAGSGTLIISGSNTYTGATAIKSGVLEIPASTALGASSNVTINSSGIFRIAGNTTISQPLNLVLGGPAAFGTGGGANSTANFTVDVPSGSSVVMSGAVTNASGSFMKTGAGALTFTNSGTNSIASVAALALTLQNGSLVFDGGATSIYNVGSTGEFTVGDNTPNQVSATIASGTINVPTYTSIGRGNGTTGLSSSLNVTGGTLNTLNLFTGYANGVAGYNANPQINISGTGVVNATTIRFGESAGTGLTTVNLSNSSVLTGTGDNQIGFGGRAVVNVSGSATYNLALLNLGMGNNAAANVGAGVINQTGGTVQQAGATVGDWIIGGNAGANNVNAYGAYNISGGAFNTGGRNFQVGAYGRGVLDVSGGTVDVSNGGGFPVIGRFAGGMGVVNISGSGSLRQNAASTLFIIGEDGSGVLNISGGNFTVAAGAGAAGNGGGTGGIRLGHVATGSGILNLNGGTVTTTGIAESAGGGSSAVYLNGGTVIPAAPNPAFMQGIDSVIVGPGGAIFDTNGKNITITQALQAPTGSGLQTVPLLSGGSGYLSQPIVRITGGGGGGATAIAIISGGVVTGITMTNPGIGYTSAPTVSLLGGGALTEASVDGANEAFSANDTTGGLTKTGNGVLTLSGSNTYAGSTNLNGGTLLLGSTTALPTNAKLNLSTGTTLNTGGFNVSTGQLNVNGSAVIDLGTTDNSTLTFADAGAWSGILNIWNYTGGAAWTASLGDKLTFTSQGTINLANVHFFSDNGTVEVGTGGAGFIAGNELVPVPESGAVFAGLAILGAIGFRERRRRSA